MTIKRLALVLWGIMLWGAIVPMTAAEGPEPEAAEQPKPQAVERPERFLRLAERDMPLARQAARDIAREEGDRAYGEFIKGEPISLLKKAMPEEVQELIAQALVENHVHYKNFIKKIAKEKKAAMATGPRDLADIQEPWRVSKVGFSPGGSFVVVAANRPEQVISVRWFNPDTNAFSEIAHYSTNPETEQTFVNALFVDDATLAIATSDKKVTFFDVHANKALRTITLSDVVWDDLLMVVSPDGKKIALFGSHDPHDKGAVWDVATGKKLYDIKRHGAEEEEQETRIVPKTGFRFSEDGKRFLTVQSGKYINIYNAQDGSFIRQLAKPEQEAAGEASSVAVEQEEPLPQQPGVVAAPGGAGAGRHNQSTLPFPEIFDAEFSPDGFDVLGYGHGEAWVWDSQTGEHIYTLSWDSPANFINDRAIFNLDSTKIFVSTAGGRIITFDSEDGRKIGTLTPHAETVPPQTDVTEFLLKNKRVLTAYTDTRKPDDRPQTQPQRVIIIDIWNDRLEGPLQEIEVDVPWHVFTWWRDMIEAESLFITTDPQATRAFIQYGSAGDPLSFFAVVNLEEFKLPRDLTIPQALFLNRLAHFIGTGAKLIITQDNHDYPIYKELHEKYPYLVNPFVVFKEAAQRIVPQESPAPESSATE